MTLLYLQNTQARPFFYLFLFLYLPLTYQPTITTLTTPQHHTTPPQHHSTIAPQPSVLCSLNTLLTPTALHPKGDYHYSIEYLNKT